MSLLSLAVLGDPVNHTLSPSMQNAALHALGIEGEYVAVRASANEFEECVARLRDRGFVGANVTIPHKERAAGIGEADDEIVPATGAANTLKFLSPVLCRNTDVPGFLRPLQSLTPGAAFVLGAGGAAAAAVYALLFAGWQVRVWNRTPDKAVHLAEKFGCAHTRDPDPACCSLVVNATPLGLHSGEMPELDWESAPGESMFYDLAYRDGPTDFLERARSLGHRTIDGREMLVEQGALSLEWWTGQTAPRQVMREAIGLA
ncbi:MAG: shikimate dehydrogenase [Armatimonadetes bacterium]|nr:shikimate dehydrogenase [Armatimonadota bacterium]